MKTKVGRIDVNFYSKGQHVGGCIPFTLDQCQVKESKHSKYYTLYVNLENQWADLEKKAVDTIRFTFKVKFDTGNGKKSYRKKTCHK